MPLCRITVVLIAAQSISGPAAYCTLVRRMYLRFGDLKVKAGAAHLLDRPTLSRQQALFLSGEFIHACSAGISIATCRWSSYKTYLYGTRDSAQDGEAAYGGAETRFRACHRRPASFPGCPSLCPSRNACRGDRHIRDGDLQLRQSGVYALSTASPWFRVVVEMGCEG